MGYINRVRIPLAVTSSGGASQTFYSSHLAFGGLVEAIRYTRATASGISTAANITLTAAESGLTIWTATATGDVTRYPRGYAHDVSGGELGFTSAATPPPIPVRIPVGQEAMKVVVTSGGTGSGGAGGVKATLDIYLAGV